MAEYTQKLELAYAQKVLLRMSLFIYSMYKPNVMMGRKCSIVLVT